MQPRARIMLCLAMLALLAGCTRARYLRNADRDSYQILHQKSGQRPWQPPDGYNVLPHPASRFFDPSTPTDPTLPPPTTQLYGYTLPEFPKRDPRRFRPQAAVGGERLPAVPAETAPHNEIISEDGVTAVESAVRQQVPQPELIRLVQATEVQEIDGPLADESGDAVDTPKSPAPARLETSDGRAPVAPAATLRVPPLPHDIWDSMPDNCLRLMFEFGSVREEYERSFDRGPTGEQRVDADRMALEDLLQVGLVNSREYQTQKELLYLAALRLTFERYDFMLKFRPFGNGTNGLFTHDRQDGVTQNTLVFNTSAAMEKTLASGGDFIARFANDVVLTFNGPDGFSADVGSELFFGLTQPLLQRDVVFERLTQAERNVVYAARDFARYRKVFFRDLTSQYYGLLLSYRRIEIDTQDYFSTWRAFYQGEAEYRTGRLPRFQVDQLEQNALASRSRLIASCVSLEKELDTLKFRLGLPPELDVHLQLGELDDLTLRGRTAVSSERVRRSQNSLNLERNHPRPDRSVLLNNAVDLAQRLADLNRLREELGQNQLADKELAELSTQLTIEETRQVVAMNRAALQQAQGDIRPAPLRLFERTMDVVQAMLEFDTQGLALLRQKSAAGEEKWGEQIELMQQQADGLRVRLDEAVSMRALDQVAELAEAARTLLQDTERLTDQIARKAGVPVTNEGENLDKVLGLTTDLLRISQQALSTGDASLPALQVAVDDAMLTAIVERFDLMNQRGDLADAWRAIKLAGDDLRSILNLQASQSIRTPRDLNRPFDFNFDDSTTRLGFQFDAPLNRRSQRNQYRATLINYQAALRGLLALEDSIKLEVRDDLRQLQLDREQYRIAVASAALAYERVVSTRLQLQLGVRNIAARDFLEAQQAYTASLSSVAAVQIRYVLNRIDLFLDLEQLQVDEQGFWPELYDASAQPALTNSLPEFAYPPFGELPPNVWYSRKMRRMEQVPTASAP